MIKNGATYFKWLVILLIFVLLFLTFRRCGKDINYSPPRTDTTKVRVDTIWKESKTDTQWIPEPRGSYTPHPEFPQNIAGDFYPFPDSLLYKVFDIVHDTLEIDNPLADSILNVHLKDYISFKYYRDTIKTQYGYIVVIDTVTRSRIASRRTISQFNVPTIEKVVTLRQPKRVVLYGGIDVMGNQATPLWGTGINLSIKFKNDKIWKVGAMLNKTGETMYNCGAQIPIRLRKQ